jgi:hypothetical protein
MQRAAEHCRALRFDTLLAPGAVGGLQTPRIFSRRDARGTPLIIARP